MKAEFSVEDDVFPARPDVAVLRVRGEIDTTNAHEFGALLARHPRPLVIDLGPILYCDSAAFAVLDRVLASGTVALAVAPPSPIRRAAAVVGLPVHDSLREAVQALRAGSGPPG